MASPTWCAEWWWAIPASLRRDGNACHARTVRDDTSVVGNTSLSSTRWKLALRRSPKPGAFTGGQHQSLFDVMETQAGTSSNKERQTEVGNTSLSSTRWKLALRRSPKPGAFTGGNTSLSSTRWKRLASDSAPVLRCTPGAPHLPPRPLPLPQEERKGSVGWLASKNVGNSLRNGRICTLRAS